MRVLKPRGTLWIIAENEYVAELKVLCTRDFGLACTCWVIWSYPPCPAADSSFARSHSHLLCFTRSRSEEFVIPDSGVWFTESRDKRESLVERIILACTKPGDVLLDPFAGGGTSVGVATRLGCRAIGIENDASLESSADCLASNVAIDQHEPRVPAGIRRLMDRAKRLDDLKDPCPSRELANALSISPKTLVDWCQEREYTLIPCFKIGNRWYHRTAEVKRWLNGLKSGQVGFRRKPRPKKRR